MPRHQHKLTVIASGDTKADTVAAACAALYRLHTLVNPYPVTFTNTASRATARFHKRNSQCQPKPQL